MAMLQNLTFGRVVTIGLAIVLFSGVLMNIGKGLVMGFNYGNWRPLIDSTVGQVLYWDDKIYEGFNSLRNQQLMSSMPESIRDEYYQFIVQTIVFYTTLFGITAYGLFKLSSWAMGEAAFNPTTDIAIWLIIFLVFFPFTEFLYGYAMYGKMVVPYRGVFELFKPANWELLLKDTSSFVPDINQTYSLVNSNTVLTSGE